MKRVENCGGYEERVLRAHIELSRAFLKIRARETAWMTEYGLTIPQFGILELLYHRGALAIGEITKLILSTPGNITVVIKNLESKGWIEVVPSEKDRRVRVAAITGEGRGIVRSIFPGHVENLVNWYGRGLEEAELQTLTALLRKLEKAQ